MCICVCVCGLSRQCQEIPRVDLNITPRHIVYMGNTLASEDVDICKSLETPLSVPFWNE